LLDVELPGIDGIDGIARLRELAPRAAASSRSTTKAWMSSGISGGIIFCQSGHNALTGRWLQRKSRRTFIHEDPGC